ncbi:putative saposin B type domain-containing protein [Dioscorea sansibarensis]
MKMLWSFGIILSLVALHVDARVEIMSMSADSGCGSCLEFARNAEKEFKNLKLFEEVVALSKQVCQALPNDLEIKCLKKSRDYIQYARVLFQEFFHEKSLCNSTRLCDDENGGSEDEDKSCSKCKKYARIVISEIQNPRTKTKVTNAMLNFCEEKGEDREKCDEAIYQYGAAVLDKLEKAKANNLCSALQFCKSEEEDDFMQMEINM